MADLADHRCLVFPARAGSFSRQLGLRVRLTLEIDAESPEGFSEADMEVVRDNARQLKFKAESTRFGS